MERVKRPWYLSLIFALMSLIAMSGVGGVYLLAKWLLPQGSAILTIIMFALFVLYIYFPYKIWTGSRAVCRLSCYLALQFGIVQWLMFGPKTWAAALMVHGTIFGVAVLLTCLLYKLRGAVEWYRYVEWKRANPKTHSDSDASLGKKNVPRSDIANEQVPIARSKPVTVNVGGEHKKKRRLKAAWAWMMQPRLSWPWMVLSLASFATSFGFYSKSADAFGRRVYYSEEWFAASMILLAIGTALLTIALISFGRKQRTDGGKDV